MSYVTQELIQDGKTYVLAFLGRYSEEYGRFIDQIQFTPHATVIYVNDSDMAAEIRRVFMEYSCFDNGFISAVINRPRGNYAIRLRWKGFIADSSYWRR